MSRIEAVVTALQLPPCRPERVAELLQDWAENHEDMSLKGVMAELEHLYREYFAEIARMEMACCAGNV